MAPMANDADVANPPEGRSVERLFALTLFVSASLLFCVQPMVGKMVLPLLGGSPSVWNTCMVFFQATLLLGYLWAHIGTRLLSPRRQAIVQIVLLGVGFLVLPLVIDQARVDAIPHGESPIGWLLLTLGLAVGLPFLALSTSNPVLQRWFASTGRAGSEDPYFLYAASNAGSMLALLGYPIVVEPWLRLGGQGVAWTFGYGILVGLTGACAVAVYRSPRVITPSPSEANDADRRDGAAERRARPVTWRRRLSWIALSFAPSSLMLGVTTYLTTDIAAIPLLWVLPLALYLLSFVIVFARRPIPFHPRVNRALCLTSVPLIVAWVTEATHPAWVLVPLHLFLAFAAAVLCHRRLAQDRPAARDLTEFYLLMSVGGVLGGLFNAVVAPMLFSRVFEYPLVMLLACALLPDEPREEPAAEGADEGAANGGTGTGTGTGGTTGWTGRTRLLDLGAPAMVGALTFALILGVQAFGLAIGRESTLLMFCGPAILAYSFVKRPRRFAAAMLALLLVASFTYVGIHGRQMHTERNFFGVSRVTRDPAGPFRLMVHGSTVHGRQWLAEDAAAFGVPANEPLAYYHRTGPIGQVFAMLASERPEARPVAVVGLGAGAIASYRRPGQELVFYEIDPAVAAIASDARFFTFLRDAPGAGGPPAIVLGDARLRLRDAPQSHYGLLVIDAFSSDAVPIHLVTREAIALYLSRLRPDDGILAMHISSRFVDLAPVLAALAADANLVCLVRDDAGGPPDEEEPPGKEPSRWAVFARDEAHLGSLGRDERWRPARGWPGASPWTDDWSNLLGTLAVWGRPPR